MSTTETTQAAKSHGHLDLKQLASIIYEVPYRTLLDDIKEITQNLEELATKKSYRHPKTGKIVKGRKRTLNTKQLTLIVKHCGDPNNWTFNGKKFIRDKE